MTQNLQKPTTPQPRKLASVCIDCSRHGGGEKTGQNVRGWGQVDDQWPVFVLDRLELAPLYNKSSLGLTLCTRYFNMYALEGDLPCALNVFGEYGLS